MLNRLAHAETFTRALARLRKKPELRLSGLIGSSRSLIAAGLFAETKANRRLLLVTPGVETAAKAYGDLQTFLGPRDVAYFPFSEVLPGDNLDPPPEITSQRLHVLNRLLGVAEPLLVVAPVQALITPAISPEILRRHIINLQTGQELDRDRFIRQLSETGYQRSDLVAEPAQFAIRGGIIDFFPLVQEAPIRLEFTGQKIASLRFFNPSSQLSVKPITSVIVLPAEENRLTAESGRHFLPEYFADNLLTVFWEFREIKSEAEKFQSYLAEKDGCLSLAEITARKTPRVYLSTLPHSAEDLVFQTEGIQQFNLKFPSPPEIWRAEPLRILGRNESQIKRLRELFAERRIELHPESVIATGYLTDGFSFPEIDLIIFSDSEIFGRYRAFRPGLKPFFQAAAIATPDEIKPGDYVVHLNEGIGKFLGIQQLTVSGRKEEVLQIEYADGILLYVPVNQINLVHRYAGSEKTPVLSRLGSRSWIRTREKVKQGVRDLASDLMRIYRYRKENKGFAYPSDSDWQNEFENEFIYEETPDQTTAIAETKKDLQSTQPMDRLICGDVGYGKTEVAMRAAFKVVESGRQAALICPTTILAEQHLHTFRERFADFPVRIENLSRFRSPAQQKQTVGDLKEGRVDIIIGTHRLLSRDIAFKNLGLWIVDEEQRFGVTHKERLRAQWPKTDILTLSATPIPRTLQLSFTGLRDLSVIETPPTGRQAIITALSPYREDLVTTACLREIERGGQVFFIHNRVEDIESVAGRLKILLPDTTIAVAHGQMPEKELAQVMNRFLDQKIDILTATSIVESGLDIPTANTIIINNSQNFGLADLYQLRGRVGRYKNQAYCYLLYKPTDVMTEDAAKRLNAISEFSRLGSGLRLALADLEIRGAGNILGKEQHGFIESVGFYLYSQLFREAVAELTGRKIRSDVNISKISGAIPDDYVASDSLRLSLYRRIFGLSEETEKLAREMADRFGPLPEETRKFLAAFTQS